MQTELDRFESQWAEAELRGDTTLLDRVLTDDFMAVGPRGFTLTKAQWIDRFTSGDYKNESFDWDDVSERLYGNAAVLVGRQTTKSTWRGQDTSGQFRVTQVLVKQGEGWRLAGVHLSPIQQGP